MGSPHVVMVPIFPAGHCTPLLVFAKQLAAAGITVTIVSSDKHIAELIPRHTDQSLPSLRFLGLRDGSEQRSHMEVLVERTTPAGRDTAARLLFDLIVEMPELPVCILNDKEACWAQDAAEKLRIPKHLLYVSPVATLTIGYQAERLAGEGRLPVTPETQDIPITDIPGLPVVQPMDLPSLYLLADTFEWTKFNEYRYATTDVLLTNSFYALEHQVIDALRNQVIGAPGVQTKYLLDVGPLLPETPEVDEEREPCLRWLNTQKAGSVLYVCFGSHSTHKAPQLRDLAEALEDSGHPFLWIARPPDSLPIDGEASGAPTPSMTAFLPPGFEERIKERGMCYSGWAPQRRILDHVATRGFLSHCGWNSTLDSVCAGMPMLTWPFYADQNINNRFLVDTIRVAIEMEREPIDPEQDLGEWGLVIRRVRKEEIVKKVRRFIEEEEGRIIRQNMQQMKLNAQRAVAPGGSSRNNFESYVQLLKELNHKEQFKS